MRSLLITYALNTARTETVAGISALAITLTIAALGIPLYLLAKMSQRK